jgi:glutamate-1-semialdehyde 2,1-aminomutase
MIELSQNPSVDAPRDDARSASKSAFLRERKVVPGGSMRAASWFKPYPSYVSRGEGCYVYDLDGSRILDCANNFFSLVHGHAFPPVIEAIKKTLGRGTAFGLPTESEIQLAELLRERNPRFEQTRFCNSGTEAVMHAIKGARGVTGRERIAKFEGCYHGAYDWVEVSLAPNPDEWNDELGNPRSIPGNVGTPASVMSQTVVLPFEDAKRCAEILEREGPTLAAVILDTNASRSGMVPVSLEVAEVVQRACERHGIILIVDDVISYRLSVAGSAPLYGLKPDLITTAKIIGGGMPIGAVSGRADVMAVFNHADGPPKVSIGGTFSGNPLSMVAGLTTLQHYDAAAVDRLNSMADALRVNVNSAFESKGVPAQIVGSGSLFRLHLKSSAITGYRTAYADAAQSKLYSKVQLAMLADGVLLTPNCSGGLSTPMSDVEVNMVAELIVKHAINAIEAGVGA